MRWAGRRPRLWRSVINELTDAEQRTQGNDVLTLQFCVNYGGRAEIVNAVRAMMAAGMQPEEVTEEALSRHLYTAGLPDPDLVIRTAGEMRLSNFLLWQAAYAEYYSTDKLWPDFTAEDLRAAVAAFASRKRKYGRL